MAAKPRKLMPEDPITFATLMQYHREVLLPDVERVVDSLRSEMIARFVDVDRHFDTLYQRLDRLETEYHMLVAGLKRVEERLDRVEGGLDRVEGRLDAVEQRLGSLERNFEKVALRSELEDLKARVDGLQAQIRALEERLSA